MLIAVISLYIMGWLSVSVCQIGDERLLQFISMKKRIKQILIMSLFFWWTYSIMFLAGFISEAIKDKKEI